MGRERVRWKMVKIQTEVDGYRGGGGGGGGGGDSQILDVQSYD